MFKRKIIPVLAAAALLGCAMTDGIGIRAYAQTGSVSRVFAKVNPAVVKVISLEQPGQSNPSKVRAALGSGVIVSEDGLIMTAAHTVNVADKVVVQFLNKESTAAEVIASSAQADIALLKLDAIPENLTVAELGDSDKVSIGDQIFVIGAPYGIDHTLTVGHISGRRQSRTICQQLEPFEFLQTDAAINQGNSGGPMFDSEGRVVGIVSRILSRTGGSMGLGFAVSINTARDLLLEQKNFWIGFDSYMLAGPLARAFNVPQDAGLLVQNVAENSPGDLLGLRPGTIPIQVGDEEFKVGGDIVLSIQDFPVAYNVGDACAIQDVVGGFTSETEIRLKVLRDGEIIDLPANENAAGD